MVLRLPILPTRYLRIFFFKKKTAYEMRISDWSSDVCSSDLDDHGDEPEADGDGEEAPDQPAGLSGVDGEQRAHEGAGRFRFRDRPDAAPRPVVRLDADAAAPIGAPEFARRTAQKAISRIPSLPPGDIRTASPGTARQA